jgi:peptide/nickel transport system substrate-binding protein
MLRRDALKWALGSSATFLLAACSAPAPSSPAPGTSAAQPAGGTAAPSTSGTAAPATSAATVAPATSSGETPKPGGSITFGLPTDPIDLDPLRSRAFVDRDVHYQMYDSLVRVSPDGTIIPWLAESWDTSADGKTVTFKLRKDVTYHDGTPFDAESARWNLDRYRLVKDSARSGELASIDSVDVVDPSTLRLNLKAPFSPLLAQLVDRAGMMLSRPIVEAGGDDFTRKPFKAGSGPFILTESVKDDHLTLEKNPNWWGRDKSNGLGKLPYLDKIVFKPITDSNVRTTNLRTGNIDLTNAVPGKDIPVLKAESGLVYQQQPGLAWYGLSINRAAGYPFQDARAVKAVATAIDRQEIIDKVYVGAATVGYGALAPPHFAYDPSFKPFGGADPDAARKLIDEMGKGPLAFEFLLPSGDPLQSQLGQLIQSQLKKAGIDAQLAQLESAEILKLQVDHTYKGMILYTWSGRIDPDGNTYDQVYTGRPFNDMSYSNAEVDRLLDEQRTTSDQARRTELLRRAEQIYAVEDPAKIFYGFPSVQLAATKKIHGLDLYPDGRLRLQTAWLA